MVHSWNQRRPEHRPARSESQGQSSRVHELHGAPASTPTAWRSGTVDREVGPREAGDVNVVRQTAGIWGPAAFCGASLVAARYQPGYSHRRHHVSGLAARGARSATAMVPGFVTLGAATLMMPTPDPTLAKLARVAGTTTIVAGLIPVSEPRCPQPGRDPAATASDVGHAVASVATFLVWTAMPNLAGRHGKPGWYRFVSRVLGFAAGLGFVAAGATTQTDSPHKGLAQRAFLGIVFAWYAATAVASAERRSD